MTSRLSAAERFIFDAAGVSCHFDCRSLFRFCLCLCSLGRFAAGRASVSEGPLFFSVNPAYAADCESVSEGPETLSANSAFASCLIPRVC